MKYGGAGRSDKQRQKDARIEQSGGYIFPGHLGLEGKSLSHQVVKFSTLEVKYSAADVEKRK